MKLYAVRVFVRDFEAACAFYRDTLGLTERLRNDDLGWAEYDVGGPCLGIERAGDAEAGGLVGRFLGVSLHVDDVAATHRELEAKGVRFSAPPEKQPWGGTLAHLVDPDGNTLTLLG